MRPRRTSVVAIPASRFFKIAMICFSLNLLGFIFVLILGVGLHQQTVTFEGSPSPEIIFARCR